MSGRSMDCLEVTVETTLRDPILHTVVTIEEWSAMTIEQDGRLVRRKHPVGYQPVANCMRIVGGGPLFGACEVQLQLLPLFGRYQLTIEQQLPELCNGQGHGISDSTLVC